MDLHFWLFFVLGLLALVLLSLSLMRLWAARETAQDRLQAMADPSVLELGDAHLAEITASAPSLSSRSGVDPALGRGTRPSRRRLGVGTATLSAWLSRWPGMPGYARFVQQTGWPLTVAQALLLSLGLAGLTAVLALLLGTGAGLALPLALLAALGGQGGLWVQRQRRAQQLQAQLPDALDLMARSMQAGHAFSSALQLAARECPRPMGPELASVFGELQYGATVQDALGRWTERVAGEDVRIFVTGVRIQTETGGNLAELMQQSAALIRERQTLRGSIRVLSAEGRISALILTLLPFVLGALLTALNPQFMGLLWHDPKGQQLVSAALLLMGLGVLWMWRMVQIRV